MKVLLLIFCFLLVACSATSNDSAKQVPTKEKAASESIEKSKKEKYSRARMTSLSQPSKQLPPAVIEANRSNLSQSGGSHSVYFSRFPKAN